MRNSPNEWLLLMPDCGIGLQTYEVSHHEDISVSVINSITVLYLQSVSIAIFNLSTSLSISVHFHLSTSLFTLQVEKSRV